MTRLSNRAFVTTAALLLLGQGHARAELVDFSYAWSVTPSSVISSGTGSAALALVAPGSSQATAGSSSPVGIQAADITTSSSASAGSVDTFNNPYSLTLKLTDTTSGAVANLSFTGTITGTLTATTSQLVSTFSGTVTQTATLGNHTYSVTIDPTVPVSLPNPGSQAFALIDALVTVADTVTPPPPPPPATAPEPSSFVLGGIALTLFGLARRRRRSRAPAA